MNTKTPRPFYCLLLACWLNCGTPLPAQTATPQPLIPVGGYDTLGYAADVAVAGNYAYVADVTNGLEIIDVSDPTHCARVGGFDTFGVAYGVTVVGRYAYVADYNAGLQVIDVSNPVIIKDGLVDKILIDQAGANYTAANTFVWVASPPFVPEVSIQVSRVKVRQKVVLGRKYQLEASTQMTYWTPEGTAFTATRELIEQEFDVNETGRYFRVKEVQ